jgi:Uma2 family endonuclease
MTAKDVATNVLLLEPTSRRITEQDFFAWIEHDDVRAEWVNGEAIELMPPGVRHQLISVFLSTVIKFFADYLNLGTTLEAPIGMRIAGRSYREPDILFVLPDRMQFFDGARLNGPANFALEIVSNESVIRDTQEKYREYAEIGVQEYWLIDPRPGMKTIRAFALADASGYQEIDPDADGRVASIVIRGFWLKPEWLTADQLPSTPSVIAEIAPGWINLPSR